MRWWNRIVKGMSERTEDMDVSMNILGVIVGVREPEKLARDIVALCEMNGGTFIGAMAENSAKGAEYYRTPVKERLSVIKPNHVVKADAAYMARLEDEHRQGRHDPAFEVVDCQGCSMEVWHKANGVVKSEATRESAPAPTAADLLCNEVLTDARGGLRYMCIQPRDKEHEHAPENGLARSSAIRLADSARIILRDGKFYLDDGTREPGCFGHSGPCREPVNPREAIFANKHLAPLGARTIRDMPAVKEERPPSIACKICGLHRMAQHMRADGTCDDHPLTTTDDKGWERRLHDICNTHHTPTEKCPGPFVCTFGCGCRGWSDTDLDAHNKQQHPDALRAIQAAAQEDARI